VAGQAEQHHDADCGYVNADYFEGEEKYCQHQNAEDDRDLPVRNEAGGDEPEGKKYDTGNDSLDVDGFHAGFPGKMSNDEAAIILLSVGNCGAAFGRT